MQPFTCPQCGHKSTFDPWAETARCPRCDFSPPTSGAIQGYVRWANRHAYQPFLDELVALWQGRYEAELAFTLETPDDALAFFEDYQRVLGEDPRLRTGSHVQYVREMYPNRQEILIFAGAYFWLRRGDRAQARRDLLSLTLTSPQFVEPWLWLSATTDERQQRLEYLQRAANLDAGHPLARDALALAQDETAPATGRRAQKTTLTQCPSCGGGLQYEPGATEVLCPYCDYNAVLNRANVIDERARPVHHLRLERRYQGHSWAEAQRIAHCHGCGADLTMIQHLARHCAFCGSTNVLVEDNDRILERPDGLLPFRIDRDGALDAVRQAQRSALRRFVAWMSGSQPEIVDIEGLYVPFWVFDGVVEVYRYSQGFATSKKESVRWESHDNLLFPGVDVPARPLLERTFPFDLGQLARYEPKLLADWQARLYDLDVEIVAETASAAMLSRSRARLSQPGIKAGEKPMYQMIGTTYQLILLPLWLVSLGAPAGDEAHALVLVNGQTGRVALDSLLEGA